MELWKQGFYLRICGVQLHMFHDGVGEILRWSGLPETQYTKPPVCPFEDCCKSNITSPAKCPVTSTINECCTCEPFDSTISRKLLKILHCKCGKAVVDNGLEVVMFLVRALLGVMAGHMTYDVVNSVGLGFVRFLITTHPSLRWVQGIDHISIVASNACCVSYYKCYNSLTGMESQFEGLLMSFYWFWFNTACYRCFSEMPGVPVATGPSLTQRVLQRASRAMWEVGLMIFLSWIVLGLLLLEEVWSEFCTLTLGVPPTPTPLPERLISTFTGIMGQEIFLLVSLVYLLVAAIVLRQAISPA